MTSMGFVLMMFFAALCVAAEAETASIPRNILNNDGLVVLARAGLGDALLIDLIREKRTQFDTTADALALLAKHGLSENILRAVVEKQDQIQLPPPRLSSPRGEGDGEILLVPMPAERRRGNAEGGRWFKVFRR